MHPAEEIRGAVNDYLGGKCVIMGVTGSVAAYKSVDTARWLLRRGARVVPVMTGEAAELVGPSLLHWATGEEPYTGFKGEVGHVSLARECDSMLVAPATLATMAKISAGVVDNPVALAAVSVAGMGKSLIIAPAMHENMYRTGQYEEAARKLRGWGATIIPPVLEGGRARYPEPWLVGRVAAAVTSRGRDLEGLKVLVTAGGTVEWIDRVRFIGNPSSGRMGLEACLEAWSRGARVQLIHGSLAVDPPHFTDNVGVTTTEEMYEAVGAATRSRLDLLVAAAAPVDFKPSERAEGKVRSGRALDLRLEPTPKVLDAITKRPRVLVVFAAEATLDKARLLESAREKKKRYDADLVIANAVGYPGTGFRSEASLALMLGDEGPIDLGRIHKEVLARLIFDEARARIG